MYYFGGVRRSLTCVARLPVTLEHLVFTVIVRMCSHRILGRLRLVANDRGKPKQPFKVVLVKPSGAATGGAATG